MRPDPLDAIRIEDLIESYLDVVQGLSILPESELHNALRAFIDKDDDGAIKEFISKTLIATQNYLKTEGADKTTDPDQILSIVSQRNAIKRAEARSESNRMPIKIDEDEAKQFSQDHGNVDSEEDIPQQKSTGKRKAPTNAEDSNIAKPAKTVNKNQQKKGTKKKSYVPLELSNISNEDSAHNVNSIKDEDNEQQTENPKHRITSLDDLIPKNKKMKIASHVVDKTLNLMNADPPELNTTKWGKRKAK